MGEFSKSPGPIPNRWLHCPRLGLGLVADKFLPFKTPLSSSYDNAVPPECRFYPTMVIERKALKKKIGLWIDLTNTERFYNKMEVKERKIKYLKLECRGHGETPSELQTDMFIKCVHNFITTKPLEVIGVHCTHGFNRTGFLIVAYLVTKHHCSLESALAQFAQMRPPGIYKGDYLKELYKRYDDIDDAPEPPILPDWCNEYDDSEGNESSLNKIGTSTNHQQIRNKKPASFMEGVLGVTHFQEQPKASLLQRKVRKMCNWERKDFPGSQPVSMDRININFLQKEPYRVSWKADGMRYMMLINNENEVYFFDRNHNPFKVEGIQFPRRAEPSCHLTNTLVDGEMVIDQVGGKAVPRYLIYDIVVFEDKDVGQSAFYPTRLNCIHTEIIQPRYKAMAKGHINKALEPFSIRQKDFWDITQTGNLLGDKFSKMLSHEPDGLIFQPSNQPYVPGRCEEVLKWKPLSLNSVDFRLKIETESGMGILPTKIGCLYVGQKDQPYGQMKYTKALKELNNKIIECKFENGGWVFMRERTDKSFPNSFDTAQGVWKSITEPVTKEFLLEFIEHKRFIDDSTLMGPPQKKPRKH